MSDVATTNQANAQMMESVLADGDLGKLSAEQRVAYYFKVCESLGLNPYTRPFDYITLNGKKVLYAKRDATDQLRNIRGITLTVTDKQLDDDLFVVTVRATDARGRSDEDFGAVPMGNLKGEARANAMLKAITKAKRRVTLSICGMGMNDQSEVEDIPGAEIEHIDLPPRPSARDEINASVPLRAAATAMPRAPTVRAPAPTNGGGRHSIAPPAGAPDEAWRECLDKVGPGLSRLRTLALVEATAAGPTCGDIMQYGPEWAKAELAQMLADNVARFKTIANAPEHAPSDPVSDTAEELPEIVGEQRVHAG